MVWQCPDGCSGNGSCQSGTCACYIGWFTSNCSRNAISYYNLEWDIITVTMAGLFAAVTFFAGVQLLYLLLRKKSTGFYRKAVLLFILLAAGVRAVWCVLDPFGLKGLLPLVAESLMSQLVPGFIGTAFNFIIAIWIKLIMVTHPSPPRYCPPITPVLMLGNLLAWLSLIPCAVLFRTVDQESANWVMLAYTLYVCAYLFCIAAGFLSFGLKVYFSVRRVVGPSLMRSKMVTKFTILAVLTSVLAIATIASLLLGCDFAINFASSPEKFIIFQMVVYRAEELLFCILVLILAGDWEWRRCQTQKSIGSTLDDYTYGLSGEPQNDLFT